jgi:hypothetical protein
MAEPVRYVSTGSLGGTVTKANTQFGVIDADYSNIAPSGDPFYSGVRNPLGYAITKAISGKGPLIYCPANDNEVILFCNTTANPSPSTVITTIEEALIFLQKSEYMVTYSKASTTRGVAATGNFPSKLPMEGLSCYVDSQIPISVGANGKWLDVSGNGLEFQSYGTALQLTSLGGVQAFKFNDSGYFQANDLYSSVDMGGDCTLVMWVWCTEILSRDTIFEKVGDGTSSYKQEIAVTWETSEAFSYYSRRIPAYDHANTSACDKNGGEGAWTMMAIKMSTGRTATARTGFYSKNGANWNASYTSRSNTALDSALQIRIGNGYAGPVEGPNGIGAVLTYNKMLSNTEINNVYESTRERYGL